MLDTLEAPVRVARTGAVVVRLRRHLRSAHQVRTRVGDQHEGDAAWLGLGLGLALGLGLGLALGLGLGSGRRGAAWLRLEFGLGLDLGLESGV